MRIISIEDAQPGMVLAKPIYHLDDGKMLLRENIVLKDNYINRLKELQYTHLYIREQGDSEEDLRVLEPIRQETKVKASVILKETFSAYEQNPNYIHVENLQSIVSEMIEQIFSNRDVIYNMIDIRTHDNYTFSHSVNVCALSLIVGSWMGLNHTDLEVLGIGALLHDIGKIFISHDILNKPSLLEPHEYEIIKSHTNKGYELLKEKVCISFISAHIAYQHHERLDGSGYPRGLAGNKIHRFAKIVAVADVYDAMTAQRVYREAVSSHNVLSEIKMEADKKFERSVVEAFERVVAPYPIGSLLLLNNGETVLVLNVTRSECKVRVVSGEREGQQFNLYRYPEICVVEMVTK
jgi:putative nucleotidyltransferase with HDIG domain